MKSYCEMVSSMAKKILLIVEGPDDEVRFYNSLFQNCFRKQEYKIYPYRTTIHILAQELYNNYPEFEDDQIDIRLVLSSLTDCERKKAILRQNYSDIFLIFDFDPHHDHPHFDTVRRMLAYFSDSTSQGKLYINYPMMQSYKHFSTLPDNDFSSRVVTIEQIKEYKRLVGAISRYTDLNKYDYNLFFSLAVHHLKKVNYLLCGEYSLPTCEEYLSFDLTKVYDLELSLFETSQEVSVVNTCILMLCDFAPNRFYRYVIQHKADLMI